MVGFLANPLIHGNGLPNSTPASANPAPSYPVPSYGQPAVSGYGNVMPTQAAAGYGNNTTSYGNPPSYGNAPSYGTNALAANAPSAYGMKPPMAPAPVAPATYQSSNVGHNPYNQTPSATPMGSSMPPSAHQSMPMGGNMGYNAAQPSYGAYGAGAGGSRPVMRDDSNVTVVPINAINPYSNK